jgi:hypothetical protein
MAQYGTLTADGDTSEVRIVGDVGGWAHYSGDFDGGTMTLYFKGLDGNWHAIANSDKAAADDFQVEVPHGTYIRGTLTGAGVSASIYWQFHSTRTTA